MECTLEMVAAAPKGKRKENTCMSYTEITYGIVIQFQQSADVPLSGRRVLVTFPACERPGAATDVTESIRESQLRRVGSSADVCHVEGRDPAGYDRAVLWLFNNKRWAVHAHVDTLARLLLSRERAPRPPLDAVHVLSIGEGTGVVGHIFHDVLAGEIARAAGQPMKVHLDVRELAEVHPLVARILAQNASSAHVNIFGDVCGLQLRRVGWYDYIAISIHCRRLSYASGGKAHLPEHAEFMAECGLEWNETGRALIWCALVVAQARVWNPGVSFHFETTANCRSSATAAVVCVFNLAVGAKGVVLDCASLSAMTGMRHFTTSKEVPLPTHTDTAQAPTLSEVVARRISTGMASDLVPKVFANRAHDKLCRPMHGFYMSSMREGGSERRMGARRNEGEEWLEIRPRGSARCLCACSENGEGAGPATDGAFSTDHALCQCGRFDGYRCQVEMSRVQADGSLVEHSGYMLPMDPPLMADLLQLPSTQFVCLTGIPGITWATVAQLLSSAVPAGVVLFVIRHNFAWADCLRARAGTPLPNSMMPMPMPHAPVLPGRKTVTAQTLEMFYYDEIKAGRQNVEYYLCTPYWKTQFGQISPGEPFEMRVVFGACTPLLFDCASYDILPLRSIRDMCARCALQAEAINVWSLGETGLDETGGNVRGAEPPVDTAYAIALLRSPGPT